MNQTTEEAMKVLKKIVADGTASHRVRLDAANTLLHHHPLNEEEAEKPKVYVVGHSGHNNAGMVAKMLASKGIIGSECDIVIVDEIEEGLGRNIFDDIQARMDLYMMSTPCDYIGGGIPESVIFHKIAEQMQLFPDGPEDERVHKVKAQERDTPKTTHREDMIKAGRLFKHFKGDEYVVEEHVVSGTLNDKHPVVTHVKYRKLKGGVGNVYKRSFDRFYDTVSLDGKEVQRFTLVTEANEPAETEEVRQLQGVIINQKNLLGAHTYQINELHQERKDLRAEIARLHTLFDKREKRFVEECEKLTAKQIRQETKCSKRADQLKAAGVWGMSVEQIKEERLALKSCLERL